jgi:hypothetical protein
MRAQTTELAAPGALHGFLLRADEPVQTTFTRTPSFAWQPVRGANKYEFQLATARGFGSGALLARKTTTAPAVSLAIALPWITGTPYSLYARVRAIAPDGSAGPWGDSFGFNMRWTNVPEPLEAPAGLVRWTTVDGATGYQVWYLDAGKVFRTQTNVADEREYYSFHQDATWTGTVHWRVRAIRALYGATTARNGLPETSFGPWSPVYISNNTPFTSGPLTSDESISDETSTAGDPQAHHLMPAFTFSGDTSLAGDRAELYRVYVATDKDCVNIVYRSAVVGSPAYAPRWNGTLDLPKKQAELDAARTKFLPDGNEGDTSMSDGTPVTANEAVAPDGTDAIKSGEDDSPANGDTDTPPTGTTTTTPPTQAPAFQQATLPVDKADVGPPVDLWDTDWPTGRYYWTVVPVQVVVKPSFTSILEGTAAAGATTLNVSGAKQLSDGDQITIGDGATKETVTVASVAGDQVTFSPALVLTHPAGDSVAREDGQLSYRDLDLPQDACAAGRELTFGKTSEPTLASNGSSPYASGLSPAGKLVAAASSTPHFYGSPLVSWQPVLGASAYEIQWSNTRYPFVTATTPILTYGTSAVLPLAPGTWWYRVRGINLALPAGARAMAWSSAQQIAIAKPTFTVVGAAQPSTATKTKGTKTQKTTKTQTSAMRRYEKKSFGLAVPRSWQELEEKSATVLFGARDPQAYGGYHANVAVVVGAGRGTSTMAQWAQVLKAGYQQAEHVPVSTQVVKEPAGAAVLITFRLNLAGASVSFHGYTFDAGDRGYLVGFSLPTSADARYAKAIAASAASFSLTS